MYAISRKKNRRIGENKVAIITRFDPDNAQKAHGDIIQAKALIPVR